MAEKSMYETCEKKVYVAESVGIGKHVFKSYCIPKHPEERFQRWGLFKVFHF